MKTATTNKIVERRCCACYKIQAKSNMLRIVKIKTNNIISVDLTGKTEGRGTYLCRDTDCYQKAKKQRRIEQALRCKVPIELHLVIAQNIEQITEL